MTIIIVSEDIDDASLYASILQSEGYDTRSYKCDTVLLAADIVRPRLILIEFSMRCYEDILKYLKQVHESHMLTDRPSILILFPKYMYYPEIRALADEYLVSPVVPQHLIKAVTRLLHRSK